MEFSSDLAERARKKLLFILLFLSLAVSVAHYMGGKMDWYFTVWWFDIPMHFAGGIVAGLLSFYLILFTRWGRSRKWSNKDIVKVAIFGALAAGLLWEFYEFFVGIFDTEEFWPDTLYDVIMDIIGGGVAAITIIKIKKQT